MKRFDNILIKRIKKAFSDYNVDHLADEGWNSFVRTKKKKRTGIIIPLWAKAASVAVLLTTVGIFTYKSFINIKKTTDNQTVNIVEQVTHDEITDDASVVARETAPEDITELASSKEHITVPAIKSVTKPGVTKVINEVHYYDLRKLPVSLSDIDLDKNLMQYIDDKVWHYADLSEVTIAYEYPETGKERINLMAGVSGMMAHVDNSSSASPATSLGIYVERSITNRISLQPGFAISMHGFNLNNGFLDESNVYSAPAVNGMSGSVESYEAQFNLLAMEIPLNIVFKVWERHKSKFFVSAGASTMVYLNQKFNGSFTNAYIRDYYNEKTGSISYQTNYSEVDVENNYGAFSHADFFGLANFSAGYSVPFGTSNRLLIEPFVKVPVSDLTSLDLRVVYGGMSLKLRFLER